MKDQSEIEAFIFEHLPTESAELTGLGSSCVLQVCRTTLMS